MLKKILKFIDGISKDEFVLPKYGNLYKIQNESLPFRYIYKSGDELKGIHRFKHHQLKEYIFNNFDKIEREANLEEQRLYNIIKDHINELSRKQNDNYHY
jgi:hypothetical protein